MKVAELLERRRVNWQELEVLCERVESTKLTARECARFSSLYRAACADLALAESHHLPQNTVQYLHRLVARSCNKMYRNPKTDFEQALDVMLQVVPQRVFRDRCIQVAFALFWGLFVLSAFIAYNRTMWPDYVKNVVGDDMIEQLEEMYKDPIDGRQRSGFANAAAGGHYVIHNAGIGLRSFAGGMLILPGLLSLMFNAIFLGAMFGHMARPEIAAGENFFQFVTAHGPFELTAISLAAGAGLRLGVSWLAPGDMNRTDSLRKNAGEMLPVVGVATILFVFAAMIEGFISPSSLPYMVKLMVATMSSMLLTWYFIVLGWPRGGVGAT